MGNCKDCKYFKRFTEEDDNKMFGDCECDKFQYLETFLRDVPTGEGNYTNDMLLYRDHDFYYAEFCVGENFGCIHFTKKEEI